MSKPILKLTKAEEEVLNKALELVETIQISSRVQGTSREAAALRYSAMDSVNQIKRIQTLAKLAA